MDLTTISISFLWMTWFWSLWLNKTVLYNCSHFHYPLTHCWTLCHFVSSTNSATIFEKAGKKYCIQLYEWQKRKGLAKTSPSWLTEGIKCGLCFLMVRPLSASEELWCRSWQPMTCQIINLFSVLLSKENNIFCYAISDSRKTDNLMGDS